MNIAKQIRIRKEREAQAPLGAPRSYCRSPDCLFRIWKRDHYVECPRHPGLNPEVSEAERNNGARQSAVPGGERGEQGAPAPRSLPDSRPHPDDCQCPKHAFPF